MPETAMIEQSAEEWRDEAIQRFGSLLQAAFVCPNCGRRNTVEEFREFEDKGAIPDTAAKQCIGRFDPERGCDWAAFGLFRTLGKGRRVTVEGGDVIEVFDFAEADDG